MTTNEKDPRYLWPRESRVSDDAALAELRLRLQPVFESIVKDERLGDEILPKFNSLYLPFADWLASQHTKQPIVIGINGAQGSGKSTLSHILQKLLSHGFNKSVVQLSIDDLYLSRHRREQLAKDVHPLFITRGVPGTHDVEQGKQILSSLLNFKHGQSIKLPVFDKANDDLLPEQEWNTVDEPVDIILFEGWCVGAKAQAQHQLELAINELEEKEDPEAIWRNYINQQLKNEYQSLFDFIDYQVMLKIPDMESVFEWRSLQEQKLALSCNENKKLKTQVMSNKELTRFIMHFERLTQSTLEEMPHRADVVLYLNKQHQVSDVEVKID